MTDYSKYKERLEGIGIKVKNSQINSESPDENGEDVEVTSHGTPPQTGQTTWLYAEIRPGVYSPVTFHIPGKDIGMAHWINAEVRTLIDNGDFEHPLVVQQFHRYHFAFCQIIDNFFTQEGGSRYYASDEWSGKFRYYLTENNQVIHQRKEQTLFPCGHCLNILQDLTNPESPYDPTNFNIEIAKNKAVNNLPQDHQPIIGSIENLYPDDWQKISRKLRENAGWKCESCDDDFSSDKKNLHVHHVNHRRHDSRRANLKVLCRKCHAQYHPHM